MVLHLGSDNMAQSQDSDLPECDCDVTRQDFLNFYYAVIILKDIYSSVGTKFKTLKLLLPRGSRKSVS